MPRDSGTKACMLCCCVPVVTGVSSGVSAFNTWLGGVILESAGWAPAAVSHLPAVGAVGAATLYGPMLCCLASLLVCASEDGNIHINAGDSGNQGLAAQAVSGALVSTIGAAVLNWHGAELGFAAAAGAVGGVVGTAAIVVGILGAVTCCGSVFACCEVANDSGLSPSRRQFWVRSSASPYENITAQSVQADLYRNGPLFSSDIIDTLRQHGLNAQARDFSAADGRLRGYAPQQQNTYVPTMK